MPLAPCLRDVLGMAIALLIDRDAQYDGEGNG